MNITVTGADERTPGDELDKLADLGAEIGLLYTHSPDGRNRYPGLGWIIGMATRLDGSAALHVCGLRAREQFVTGKIDGLVQRVSRVQINGSIEASKLKVICERWYPKPIITQHSDRMNGDLLNVEIPNHQILCDGSGGRGVSPSEWVRPETYKPVGFAGGLGPDNLYEQLHLISEVAYGPWWVDMEGRLRDKDDWFNWFKASQCVAIIREWNSQQ